jgi:16S rRNA C1402 (ribose-2'-O) methylase RsmI
MDLEQLRQHINAYTQKLRYGNVVKLETMARVGYWVARYSCGWTRDMVEPSDELVALLDEAGTPRIKDPHVRLLHFAVQEVYREMRVDGIPIQRRPPPIESMWYYDLAASMDH